MTKLDEQAAMIAAILTALGQTGVEKRELYVSEVGYSQGVRCSEGDNDLFQNCMSWLKNEKMISFHSGSSQGHMCFDVALQSRGFMALNQSFIYAGKTYKVDEAMKVNFRKRRGLASWFLGRQIND